MKKLMLLCALCALVAACAVACADKADLPADTGETTPMEGTTADSSVVTDPAETSTELQTEVPTEVPTEADTEDLMELCTPTHLVTPEFLLKQAEQEGRTQCSQQIQSATLADRYITLTCSGNDPYVAAIKTGARDVETTQLLAIKYRTVDGSEGELFIGSGSGWTGTDDHLTFSYVPDGEWHLLLVDLSGIESISQKNARYFRFDFFTHGAAGRAIDVQYLAFFETAEQAEMYDGLVSQKAVNDSTFLSDVSAQTNGAYLEDTDFGQYFSGPIIADAAIYSVMDGAYMLKGEGRALATVNGSYALVTDMKKADDAYAVARYVYDKGIYAKVSEGQFVLVIDGYDKTHRYSVPAEGTELTVADSGEKLYFLVDGKLAATVALMGGVTYEDKGDTIYAATAFVSLSDGSAGKLTNTLVSADVGTSMGFFIGVGGELNMTSVKVVAFADVTIPRFEKVEMNLKDKLTASDDWTANVEELGVIANPDAQCTVKQGGWTDGTYYYQLFIKKDTASDEEDNIVKLVKYNIETGEVVKVSEDLGLNHANDLTYNPKRNIFVAVHNNPHRKKLSLIDPDTFEVVDTVTLGCKIFSLDYNESRDQYVIGVAGGQKFRLLDADFEFVSDTVYEPTDLSKGYTTQGVSCDDKYIYFVLYNQNCITVYDWDGKFVTYVKLNISGEPENLSVVGEDIYISSAHGDGAHIYKISEWQKPLQEATE